MGAPRFSIGRDANEPVPNPGDRRRVCRYAVVLEDALLGWWQEAQFIRMPVRLVDLSVHGCLVESSRVPSLTERQKVWVQPRGLSEAEWTEGQIVIVRKRLLGKCQVRISFRAPMPYEPYKSLIYGPDHLVDLPGEHVPEHERDHFWK
jgi:hypothetical protein